MRRDARRARRELVTAATVRGAGRRGTPSRRTRRSALSYVPPGRRPVYASASSRAAPNRRPARRRSSAGRGPSQPSRLADVQRARDADVRLPDAERRAARRAPSPGSVSRASASMRLSYAAARIAATREFTVRVVTAPREERVERVLEAHALAGPRRRRRAPRDRPRRRAPSTARGSGTSRRTARRDTCRTRSRGSRSSARRIAARIASMSRTVAARRQVRQQATATRAGTRRRTAARRPTLARAVAGIGAVRGRRRRSSRGRSPHSTGALAPTPRGSHDTMSKRSSTDAVERRRRLLHELDARTARPARIREQHADPLAVGRAAGRARARCARHRGAPSRAAPTASRTAPRRTAP